MDLAVPFTGGSGTEYLAFKLEPRPGLDFTLRAGPQIPVTSALDRFWLLTDNANN